MKNKDYLWGLNIAEISLGFLLNITTFTHEIYRPVIIPEQEANYAVLSDNNYQICELRDEIESLPTGLVKFGGLGLMIHGAYSIGKRKR